MSFDLERFLPYQLAVAAARTSRRFAQLYQAEADISVPEWRVLAHLASEGSVSVREIFARVDMDKSKVSRAASRLEEAGLVTKVINAEDRRLVSLSLTSEGEALMARLSAIATDFQAQLKADLGPDAAQLEPLLQNLMNAEERNNETL